MNSRLTGKIRNLDGSASSIRAIADNKGFPNKFGSDVLTKLADYEDLEEQGRIIKLPCKVGDVVYRINIGAMEPVIPLRVVEYRFKIVGNCIREKICCSDDFLCKQPSIIYYAEDIGNKVFLTKSEAEAKLKELKGE